MAAFYWNGCAGNVTRAVIRKPQNEIGHILWLNPFGDVFLRHGRAIARGIHRGGQHDISCDASISIFERKQFESE